MNEPYVFIMSGCCMSSYIITTACKLIKKHNYNINCNLKTELYKPKKNFYYEDDMNLFNLLKKTLSKEEKNLRLKLPFKRINKEIYNLLKKHKSKVVFISRYNKLDVLFCRYKDFEYKRKKFYETFTDWRNSQERKDLKFEIDNNKLINKLKNIKNEEEKNEFMINNFKQKEMILSEKLVNLCFDEWNKLFKILDLKLDKDIFNDFFKNTIIKKPINNKKIIKKENLIYLKKN